MEVNTQLSTNQFWDSILTKWTSLISYVSVPLFGHMTKRSYLIGFERLEASLLQLQLLNYPKQIFNIIILHAGYMLLVHDARLTFLSENETDVEMPVPTLNPTSLIRIRSRGS